MPLLLCILDTAFGAESAHQALGKNSDDGGGDKIRIDPHIDESRYCCGGIVRMQGRKDEVTCQCRLRRNLGGFLVTNLPDKDDIRIQTQDAPQHRSEGQIYLGVYLDLLDTLQLVFDWIFYSDDVYFGRAYLVDSGIKGCGFA